MKQILQMQIAIPGKTLNLKITRNGNTLSYLNGMKEDFKNQRIFKTDGLQLQKMMAAQ